MHTRPVVMEDAEMIRRWRNQPDVAAQMYTDHLIGETEHAAWLAKALVDPTRRMWVVEYAGRGAGLISVYNIQRAHRRCECAIYIAEASCRRTGVGVLAQYEVGCHIFADPSIDKLVCEALVTNDAAIRGYLEFGLVQEGVLRGHIIKQGRRRDVVVLGLFREEWEAVQPELRPRIERVRARVQRQEAALMAEREKALGESQLLCGSPS